MLIQYKDKETELNETKTAKKCMIIPENYENKQEIQMKIVFSTGLELNLGDIVSITIGEKNDD